MAMILFSGNNKKQSAKENCSLDLSRKKTSSLTKPTLAHYLQQIAANATHE
ncbi:MAG: hypothetical protein II922_03385 [Succinimonas sp.]|nr:hypothetical protein [Succinimonas sp.]